MRHPKFVVPSYHRSDILQTHTLALLHRYDIPKKHIYIFVANQEEYGIYKAAISSEYNLIIGVFGLHNQRNFIVNYFQEGEYLVWLDDDVRGLHRLDDGKRCVLLADLSGFITKAFGLCVEYQCYIWGISQTDNAMSMRDATVFDFAFIPGFAYGTINRYDADLLATLEIKEDYERSVKYWLKDKCMIKFLYVSADTDVYRTRGGLQDVYPNRAVSSAESCQMLLERYPQYFRPKIGGRYAEIQCKRHISTRNYYTKLQPIDAGCEIVKAILAELKTTKLAVNYKRLNAGIGVSQAFGRYRVRKQKGLHESINNEKHSDLYMLLKQFGEKYVRQYVDFTTCQININYLTQPHYDKNAGQSYIIGLDQYIGGKLLINSYLHDIRMRPLLFEGNKWLHSTAEWVGRRVVLVYFRQNSSEI